MGTCQDDKQSVKHYQCLLASSSLLLFIFFIIVPLLQHYLKNIYLLGMGGALLYFWGKWAGMSENNSKYGYQ
jgi:hypothetical protein